jgi:hypothetical protein
MTSETDEQFLARMSHERGDNGIIIGLDEGRLFTLARRGAEAAAIASIRAVLVEKVASIIWRNFEPHDKWSSAFFSEQKNEIRTVAVLIRAEVLEEAAKVGDSYEPRCDTCPRGVGTAIRALKEKP